MPQKSYIERIEEIIKAREETLGRKLTVEEQDQAKFEAMTGLWVEASAEVAKEKPWES